jgi:hypothetical protein
VEKAMAEITAKLVGELRQKTGAGMMDCKKALTENGGDLEQAADWLRKKGISSAEKKAGKVAAEGIIDSYIHTGSRVGVLGRGELPNRLRSAKRSVQKVGARHRQTNCGVAASRVRENR